MRQESYQEYEQHKLEAAYRSACIGMLRLVIQGGVSENEGKAILEKYSEISASFANKFTVLYLALCAKESKLQASAEKIGAIGRLSLAIFSRNPDSVMCNSNPDYIATSAIVLNR
jgi:hypothetical protein